MAAEPEANLRWAVEVDTDPSRLDRELVYRYLSERSHWARGLHREVFQRSLAHSLCFGAYWSDGSQVGFARVISDYATFAYLADVFVLPEYQRRGVCSQVMEAICRHSHLQGLRRFMLVTTYASKFYARYGFTAVSHPERLMERLDYSSYALGRCE